MSNFEAVIGSEFAGAALQPIAGCTPARYKVVGAPANCAKPWSFQVRGKLKDRRWAQDRWGRCVAHRELTPPRYMSSASLVRRGGILDTCARP